ncbi:MAG TPA: ester cyclase [Ktedonobacterales bacterium]|jgi:steroid delta-isomerase-like uncharacterized protein
MPKKPTPLPVPSSIEELLAQVRLGQLSRRRFLAIVAGAGASAAAIATLAAVLKHPAQTPAAPAQPAGQSGTEQQNLQLHQQHIAHQQQRAPTPRSETARGGPLVAAPVLAQVEQMVQKLVEDYHDDAVVDDMLMGAPIVGREAIANRKRAEFLGVSSAAIEVTRRFAFGDQVVAEWTMTGVHSGDLWGFAATGQSIHVRGLTVVSRRAGKITRESLYYDADEVRRQLTRA